MSNMFTLSDGTQSNAGDSFETPSGDIAPIPDNSSVLAMISGAKWESPRDDSSVSFVQLEWTVLQPADYANRKIWQKCWVNDLDPSAKDVEKAKKKRDNAIRLLDSIDFNCGGRLKKAVAANGTGIADDDDLAICLSNRPMVIKLKVWEIKDGADVKSGNWVCAVAPKSAEVSVPNAPVKKAGSFAEALKDDVPF